MCVKIHDLGADEGKGLEPLPSLIDEGERDVGKDIVAARRRQQRQQARRQRAGTRAHLQHAQHLAFRQPLHDFRHRVGQHAQPRPHGRRVGIEMLGGGGPDRKQHGQRILLIAQQGGKPRSATLDQRKFGMAFRMDGNEPAPHRVRIAALSDIAQRPQFAAPLGKAIF